MKYYKYLLLLSVACSAFYVSYAQNKNVIQVDVADKVGDMKLVWAWFGYDEPNYTYMKDGRKLLSEIAALSPVPVYVRTHNLLTTGDGTPALKWGSTNAYTEDAQGKPVYNWKIVDSIFDTYIKRKMKPLAQIGFMPQALSIKPDPYQHNWPKGTLNTGWAYPPNNYNKWRDLVYNWVKHCVERYGKKEVESWYWEVWNEPNIGYWQGTRKEYFKLYDYAADGLKKALPTARIGGCDVAGTSGKTATEFLNAFIKHCLTDTNYATGKIGSPLDMVSFHAKGSPKFIDQSVRMNMAPQLKDIATGFKTVASYPQLKNVPIIIGESDPEGCAACGISTQPQNAYRNGTMYSSYTAASIAREYMLADQYNVNFLGAVSWSFEFEGQPWFEGLRDMATNGVDKPVLNVFRMYGMMKGDRVKAESNRMYALNTVIDSSVRKVNTDIGVLASATQHEAAIMVWNYHDDDKTGVAEPIQVNLKNIPANTAKVSYYLIDSGHSNSYTEWKKMGSPQNPTAEQISKLEKAGYLTKVYTRTMRINSGVGTTEINLERQGVALLKIDWDLHK